MTIFMLSLTDNPLILLFLINVLLFIVGMFLDAGPAIIILGLFWARFSSISAWIPYILQ